MKSVRFSVIICVLLALGLIVALFVAFLATGLQKSLPPEYRVLAKNLAQETKTSMHAFRDNKGLTEIIAEGHSGIMDLRGIKSSDADIIYIASQGEAAFAEAVRRLERLNSLPKPPSLGSVMVESFIHGLYGNVFAGYAIGVEADNKQAAINAEVLGLVAAIQKADAAHLLLPRVAEKYSASVAANNGRIVANFHEIWGGNFTHDWLDLNNCGSEIEDCTILVEIKGQGGDVRKNVHFVPRWAGNSWIYCRYDTGKFVLDRVIGRMTVNKVDTIDVTVMSPKFSTKVTYVYTGAEADKDIQEHCNKVKFSGRYRPFAGGIVFVDQRAAYFTLDDGIGWLPKCRVDITFTNGVQSKAWYWNFDRWNKGEEKLFDPPQNGLAFDPHTIVLSITFPNTAGRIESTLKIPRK